METSDNLIRLEHLIHEKLRIVLNFTDNGSHHFLSFFFNITSVPRASSFPLPFSISRFIFVIFIVIIVVIIIFDLDHSQATYHDETAECWQLFLSIRLHVSITMF